jgi:phospholipase/carboxylesterase
VALGFSNGANIAAAVLLLHPEALAGAVLLRPMAPLKAPPTPDLTDKPVLLVSGLMDPIAPPATVEPLARQLRAAGARVRHEALPASHGLVAADLRLAREALGA